MQTELARRIAATDLPRAKPAIGAVPHWPRKKAQELPEATVLQIVNSTPQGPYKFATILSQETKQLLAMDRYERRALSRRKFAIRALDDARHRSSD
jgi:hypothetical protein